MENDWVAQRYTYEDFPEERIVAGQKITLPKKPANKKSIPNFFKKKENQKFYPPDQEMVWTIHEKMTAVDSKGKPVYDAEDITKEEREFWEEQWRYRTYGYWFFNNGYLEYITGLHWFYLSYFKMRVTEFVENHYGEKMPKRGFNFPNFQDSDRDRFLFWDAVLRSRKCAGMFEITNRRDGKSYRALCTGYEYATRPENANSTVAIQSKSDDDGKLLISKLVTSWREIPAYFRPLDSGYNRPSRGINFDTPNTFSKEQRKKQATLNSWIKPFASGAVQLDGQGIDFVYHDEVGKCFSKGTMIRMFDGSVKAVEDIKEGELVMGDDSTYRKVYGCTSGREEMFRVVPKKGDSFTCNSSHILSLKWCLSQYKFRGAKKNEVVNISVKEYLNLTKTQQDHLMLWRVGVEYSERTHAIDPYFMGLWLGDGSSRGGFIHGVDPEIKNYLFDNYDTIEYSDKRTTCKSWRVKGATTQLRLLNVIGNKHIPCEYLVDSSENRLKLLAGLIDTDGSLNKKKGKPSNYEITQKSKRLAEDIFELAKSLGFGASFKPKEASMKRKDGSVYRCEVYRVTIFGNLYRVPCLIERKKALKCVFHKNRRETLRSGFSVEPVGIGDYYGFAVDGNNLFLLKDYTVTHNTSGVDVYERWKVVQETLVDNAYILGRGLVTTTIEEVSKENVQQVTKLWNNSDSTKLNKVGLTDTGLWQYFKPAYYGYRGDTGDEGDENVVTKSFVDEYGYSNIEEAKKFLNDASADLTGSDLWAFRRKYPFTINEALRAAAESSTFPTTRIYDQIDFNDIVSKGRVRQGRFIGNITERNIRFVDDTDGPFLITWEPDKDKVNSMTLTSRGPAPSNDRVGIFGVDPFDHDDTIDNRRSDASIHGLFDFNPIEPIWSTGAFLEYLHRPATASMFYNDAMKAFMFFGMKAIIENQKPGLIKMMKANGMQGYLFKTNRKDTTLSGANKAIDGISTAGRMIREELINELVEYFSIFVGQIGEKTQSEIFGFKEEDLQDDLFGHFYFNRTLRQALKFDPKDWEKFDAIVSLMLARYALVYRKRKQRPEVENKGVKLDDLFGTYDISGRVSKMR